MKCTASFMHVKQKCSNHLTVIRAVNFSISSLLQWLWHSNRTEVMFNPELASNLAYHDAVQRYPEYNSLKLL